MMAKMYSSVLCNEEGSKENIGNMLLNTDNMRRRIDEWTENVSNQVYDVLQTTKFSLALCSPYIM